MTPLSQGTRMVLEPQPIPILYIDDDAADAQVLERQLAAAVENPVICFTTPQELYDFLDLNQGPFIILVDLVLFVDTDDFCGGYAILDQLRKRPDINNTRSPILAVTGTDPDATLIERVRKSGADGFIHKPIDVPDLAAVIGRPGWFRVGFSR